MTTSHRLRSRSLAGWVQTVGARRALVRGGEVAVAMNDLPFTVLPAEHVGDAQHVLPDGPTVDGDHGALEADRVGQVTAEAGGHEVQAVVADAGEPRGEPAEDRAHLLPSGFARSPRPEQGHRVPV